MDVSVSETIDKKHILKNLEGDSAPSLNPPMAAPKLSHIDFSFSVRSVKGFGHRTESQIWTEKDSFKDDLQTNLFFHELTHFLLNWYGNNTNC